MTLDEAIAHAREVAEDNRSAVDSFLVDDYKQREMCKQCAEEHIQLAEWLEEYKRMKLAWEEVLQELEHEKNKSYEDGGFNHMGLQRAIYIINQHLSDVPDTNVGEIK